MLKISQMVTKKSKVIYKCYFLASTNSYKDTVSKAIKEIMELLQDVKEESTEKADALHNTLVNATGELEALNKLKSVRLIYDNIQQHTDQIKNMRDEFRDLEVDTEKALSKIIEIKIS